FENRAPELLPVLRDGSQVLIREDQKRVIQELIGDEFVETGLRADDEPNDRGLDLETLIDVFSPTSSMLSSSPWVSSNTSRSARRYSSLSVSVREVLRAGASLA
ncbi:MAG TPA: hypothetical protein VMS76_15580, partial [Planctomycetota bacterium]|nr:hypothetical protein [Planctomycetota bacterium]